MRFLALSALILTATACREVPWPTITPEPASASAHAGHDHAHDHAHPTEAAAPLADVTLTAEGETALKGLLDVYDAIYALLAKDTLDGVSALGAKLADSAKAAREVAGDATLEARLGEVETRARGLTGSDLEAVRLAFGEVSQALVPIIGAVASLREGRWVFMCPMAHGYQKWIQREPSLRNPYFGSKMLTCGEESDWRP